MRELDEKEKQIMEALAKCNFDYLDDDEDEFYYKIVEPFKENYKGNIYLDWASGATKGVLIFENYKFVIKIPFRYDRNYDDEQFCGANSEKNHWDYCNVEAELYESACDEHVEDCFAKTELLGYVNGYPIYKQEMALIYTSADDSTTTHTKEDEKTVEVICDDSNYDCFNTYWLSDVFAYYGEEKFYKLMNFIRNYDISDLHGNNIGYIGMKPVLVDYSGFNE